MLNQQLGKNQDRAILDGIIIIPKLTKNERKKRLANGENLGPELEINFFGEKRIVNGCGIGPNISFEDDFFINKDGYYEKPIFKIGEKVKCSVHYNDTTNNLISLVVMKNN